MKNLILLASVMLMPLLGLGQSQIAGRVLDAQTNEPLSGAHVSIEGTYLKTITDVQGRFQFTGLETAENLLKVSFMGYETLLREIDPSKDKDIKVMMQRRIVLEDEVIISSTRMTATMPSTFSDISGMISGV